MPAARIAARAQRPLANALGACLQLKAGLNWSMKLEYRYLNLEANDPPNFSAHGGTAVDDAFQVIRVGLNYHVRLSYEPLK